MSAFGSFFRNFLLWSYDRGSWQYDILCALILAFIFLTPPSFFKENRAFHPKQLIALPSSPCPTTSLPTQAPGDAKDSLPPPPNAPLRP